MLLKQLFKHSTKKKLSAVRNDGHRKRGKEKSSAVKRAKSLYRDVTRLHPTVTREIFPRKIPHDLTSVIDVINRAFQATSPNFDQLTKFYRVSFFTNRKFISHLYFVSLPQINNID